MLEEPLKRLSEDPDTVRTRGFKRKGSMGEHSPDLIADLEFAVSRHGLALADVPRDHLGKTIAERYELLLRDGESYCGSDLGVINLRSERLLVWELFPENPKTADALLRTQSELGRLLAEEHELRLPPRTCNVAGGAMPTQEHLQSLSHLLSYLDGTSENPPECDTALWRDLSLFEHAQTVAPELRAAEVAAITWEHLTIAGDGQVAETADLRNSAVILAGHRVRASLLRDAVQCLLEATAEHVEVSDQIRATRHKLDLLEVALHWPGPWQTMPMLEESAKAFL